MTKEWVDSNT